MLFKFIIFLFLSLSISFGSTFNAGKLGKEDINFLKLIKSKGEAQGFGYSLMAIAIKESSLGKYLINVNSKDFGLYQANIKSVLLRYKLKDTSWNRNKLAMKLVSDFGFASENAIKELAYWHKVHNGNWRRIWASYNGGWNYSSKRARKYSYDIYKIIRQLKSINL